MNNFTNKYSRVTLVSASTLISIVLSVIILYLIYHVLEEEVQTSVLVYGITAPLLIASTMTWWLYGLLKRLNALEEELRNSISREKEKIYMASITSAQLVINNLLNQLALVDLEIKNHPKFSKETSEQYKEMLAEATELMKQLSSVEQIDADEIKRSVSP